MSEVKIQGYEKYVPKNILGRFYFFHTIISKEHIMGEKSMLLLSSKMQDAMGQQNRWNYLPIF